MANYILTYDLYGRVPTHAKINAHIAEAGFKEFAKILEDGWYIGTSHNITAVHDYFMKIFSDNDRIVIIEIKRAKLENLQVPTAEIVEAMERN